MDAHADLNAKLAALLRAARNDTVHRLRELNIPLTVAKVETTVSRNPGDFNGWQSSRISIQQNILSTSNLPFRDLAPLLTSETISLISESVSEILDSFRSHLPFFSPFASHGRLLTTSTSDRGDSPSPTFDEDEVEWTIQHLLVPALWEHLANLPGLRPVSHQAARSLASDVLAVAEADDLSYKLTIPLSGIAVKSRITAPREQVAIRPLTAKEQGSLIDDWGIASTNFGITALPLAALELTIRTGRTAQNPDPREFASKWLCALFLNDYDVAGYRARLRGDPSWVFPGSMQMPLSLPSQPTSWPNITSPKLSNIIETVKRLDRYSISNPHSEHDLALHRFSSGVARASHVDGVLDFVIALESLLLPYDENARRGELGYRFRIHGAHLLSATKSQRRQTARQLSDLYSLRSRLVHGSSYPSSAEIEVAWTNAKDFARRGLYHAVMDRFPTIEQFNNMVLDT